MEARELLKDKIWLHTRYITEDLKNSDIVKITGVSHKGVEYWLKKHGIQKFIGKYKYPINTDRIDASNPKFMYFLGLYIADGTSNTKNKRVSIRIKDIEPLEAIKEYFETRVPIAEIDNGYHTISKELRISGPEITDYCNNLYTNKKTFDIAWPDSLNKDCFKMLVRGFIDGDGSVEVRSYSNTYLRFGSSSDNLVKGFVKEYNKFFPEIVIAIREVLLKSGRPFYHVEIRGGFDHLVKVYQDYPKFSIKRKRDKIKLLIDDIVQTYEIINHKRWG